MPQVLSGMCNGTVPRMGSTQEDDSNESGNADKNDGETVSFVANGIRIAKRGNELNWISLEPGWAVYSPPNHKTIEVTYNDAAVHRQPLFG